MHKSPYYFILLHHLLYAYRLENPATSPCRDGKRRLRLARTHRLVALVSTDCGLSGPRPAGLRAVLTTHPPPAHTRLLPRQVSSHVHAFLVGGNAPQPKAGDRTIPPQPNQRHFLCAALSIPYSLTTPPQGPCRARAQHLAPSTVATPVVGNRQVPRQQRPFDCWPFGCWFRRSGELESGGGRAGFVDTPSNPGSVLPHCTASPVASPRPSCGAPCPRPSPGRRRSVAVPCLFLCFGCKLVDRGARSTRLAPQQP